MSSTTLSLIRRLLIASWVWFWSTGAWAAAVGTLSVLTSTDAGFATPSYTSSTLRTVDYATNTLTNTNGVAKGSETLNGGTWLASTTSPPSGFAGAYSALASKAGTANSTATTSVSFPNGASYVSFLWSIAYADGSSDITFNLSDGTSRTISNCSTAANNECLASYNAMASQFTMWITGSASQMSTPATLRIVFQPPNGVKVNSITMQAATTKVCGMWSAYYFCMFQTQESRSLFIDSLAFDDGVPDPVPVVSGLDHLEIYADSSKGVTCAANSMQVKACANASCSQPYTGGVTGSIKLTKGATVQTAAYSIPAGQSYSGDVSLNANSTGTWVASATSSVAPMGSNTCAIGALTASSNCNLTVNASGLVLRLDPHYAGSSTSVQVQVALSNVCTPTLSSLGNMLLSTTASVKTGVLPTVTDASGTVRSLSNGVAITGVPVSVNLAGRGGMAFKYAAGGAAKLDLTVLGVSVPMLNGLLNLTGDVVTRVVPKNLRLVPSVGGTDLTAVTAKVAAGSGFDLKIQGEDSAGGVIPLDPDLSILGNLNLTKTVVKPTGANLKNNPGLVTSVANLVNNVATMRVNWDEVGTLSLATAGVSNFMGSGLDVGAGSLGGYNLKFVPAKFNVVPAPKCSDGAKAFAYAGQPFEVVVQALNSSNAITQNYDGAASAKADRVADGSALTVTGNTKGQISGNTLSETSFVSGVATATLTNALDPIKKLSAPESLTLLAKDNDVTANKSTATVTVRSGRIKLSNAYGSGGVPLKMPLQVQFWDGQTWVPVADNQCTAAGTGAGKLAAGALGNARVKNHKGATLAGSNLAVKVQELNLSNGTGTLLLNPPVAGFSGTIDVTLDLDAAGMAWMKSRDLSCSSTALCNPSARASFGVFGREVEKTVNVRNVF